MENQEIQNLETEPEPKQMNDSSWVGSTIDINTPPPFSAFLASFPCNRGAFLIGFCVFLVLIFIADFGFSLF